MNVWRRTRERENKCERGKRVIFAVGWTLFFMHTNVSTFSTCFDDERTDGGGRSRGARGMPAIRMACTARDVKEIECHDVVVTLDPIAYTFTCYVHVGRGAPKIARRRCGSKRINTYYVVIRRDNGVVLVSRRAHHSCSMVTQTMFMLHALSVPTRDNRGHQTDRSHWKLFYEIFQTIARSRYRKEWSKNRSPARSLREVYSMLVYVRIMLSPKRYRTRSEKFLSNSIRYLQLRAIWRLQCLTELFIWRIAINGYKIC